MFDLEKSPIRKNIKALKDGQLSIFEEDDLYEHGESENRFQVRSILKDVENMLKIMEKNKDKKLKVAVMGEVKAGKSTFINACAGRQVAYTDILEATAIVSEISYSEKEYVRIMDKHGKTARDCSLEELMEWTEEKLDNMEDFSEYEKIEIGLGNELFEGMVLVDTPGLLSITSENHEVTNEYIAQTDYVLWVINSRNLGSKAVNDFIDKIKLSGKPLIGIINKVDSEEEKTQIKQYVEAEYSSVFEEIFYISAGNAWEGLVKGDPVQENKSGMKEVIECLVDLMGDKGYSSTRTQYFQLQREREIHMKMHATISARKKCYDNELSAFARINHEMKRVISTEVKNWISKELYLEEKKKLMISDGTEFDMLGARYSANEYLTDTIEKKNQEISNFIYKKWDLIESSLTRDSVEVSIDFNYDKNISSYPSDDTSVNTKESTKDGAERGMKKGLAMAVVFAGYTSWLGPAASTVTFVNALVPCVIPFTIGGAVIGAYLTKRNTAEVENNAREKQRRIEEFYKEVIEYVTSEKKQIETALFACTDLYYEQRCEFYKEKVKKLNFDFTEPEYGRFITELEAYLQDLADVIDKMDREPIAVPPDLEELLEP